MMRWPVSFPTRVHRWSSLSVQSVNLYYSHSSFSVNMSNTYEAWTRLIQVQIKQRVTPSPLAFSFS